MGGNSHCFVPHCNSGYRSKRKRENADGEKSVSHFSAPKDPELLKKWSRAIRRKDRELSSADTVCEVHFQEEYIQRYYVTRMPDNTEHKLLRGWPLLMPGAVPSIFPSMPKYYSKIQPIRKPPKDRQGLPTTSAKKAVALRNKEFQTPAAVSSSYAMPVPAPVAHQADQVVHQADQVGLVHRVDQVALPVLVADHGQDVADHHPVQDDRICVHVDQRSISSFDFFVTNIGSIILPSSYWSSAAVVSGVSATWIRHDDTYKVFKRVVVTRDMEVKIFMKEREVNIDEITSSVNAEEMTSILMTVHKLHICKCPCLKDCFKQCAGFVKETNGNPGPKISRCILCRRMSRRRVNRDKSTERSNAKWKLKYTALKKQEKAVSRAKLRFKRKILQLKENIHELKKKCLQAKEDAFDEAIISLADAQELDISDCLSFSNLLSKKAKKKKKKMLPMI